MEFTLVILASTLSISMGFIIYRDLQSKSKQQNSLEVIEETFQKLANSTHNNGQYMKFSAYAKTLITVQELKKQINQIHNLLLRKRIKAIRGNLLKFEQDLPSLRSKVNEDFYQQEQVRAQEIFRDKNNQNLLTEEQLRAVLCDDDRNLIIAGAGSGKTRVIDFKVRYLVNYRQINPSRILLLSFSRKSANDLMQKISKNIPGIEARTIHAFSSQVIGKTSMKVLDDNKKELESYVIKALVQTLREKPLFALFDMFYKKYFSSMQPMIFYKTLQQLREDLRKINSKLIDIPDEFGEIKAIRTFKTLRGELVRSIDERYIADYLYLQGIDYAYEPRYPVVESQYYPDFYLPDHDVYLEHFAITSSGKPPEYFDNPKKYMDGIIWKRKLHQDRKTRMIESYSYRLNNGDTSAYLNELLRTNGIDVSEELTNDQVYTKISKEFGRLFTRFYRTFKLSGFTMADLKLKFPDERYRWFLQLFEAFAINLENLITKDNKFDFNDLLHGAIAKYQEGGSRTYEYIIVDEFQDTSNLAMSLIDEVYKHHPHTTLFTVGDDWQSIYGFNGSDVTILSDYANRYNGVSVQNLNNNFRSHSRIVDLGRRFISRNPAQIKKDVHSKNLNFKNSEIGFIDLYKIEEKIRQIPDNESILILYRYNDDCPLARGVLRDMFSFDFKKAIKRDSCKKNIAMMTIHASKGLEAQHVFIIFPDGIRRKFPSEIEDHFVFDTLKTNTDSFPFAEERRLMYVAITRAEQNVYFVSQGRNPNSVFWDELKELSRSVSEEE